VPTGQQPAVRKPGVCYTRTAQGQELPVIDVTHPAFEVADDLASVEALRTAFAATERKHKRLPGFLLRYFMRSAAKRSLLARALLEPEGAVLPGLSTYMMKLGTDNLIPPFDTRIDRQFAAAPGVVSMRIRSQQVAKLIAQGIETDLAQRPGVALHLINIGGGTAIDSLNSLILLRRSSPDLLRRPVTIHVLDPDTNGPSFGANALAALRAEGAPLAGLDVRHSHQAYNWNEVEPLRESIHKLIAEDSIVAASSEGALFEYASDAAVVANLRALHADGRGARVVAGSVTRADELTRHSLALTRFKLVPRGAERFAALITGTGFSVARVEPALLSDQVQLRPA
jgi:hypothetical protein